MVYFLCFYVLCTKNILTKLVGYQQPTCLCVKIEFVVGTISLLCELFTFVQLFLFMWGRPWVAEPFSKWGHKCPSKKL